MANIGYEDYAYSSEDERQVEKHAQIDTFAADNTEDDDPVGGSNHRSDENEDQDGDEDEDEDQDADQDEDQDEDEDQDQDEDQDADDDEYASFFTDYERYQYDQLKWNGIQNPRKYTIAKKKEESGDQKKAKATKPEKQDKPKALPKSRRNGKSKIEKSKKQDRPKALLKSRRKRKSNIEAPAEPAVEIPKEGEIHFDNRGNLWYSYKKNEIYVSERATFHHWIRPGLSQIENAKGTYDFARKRGLGNYNITCFNEVEEHWGLERPHYAPVMFEWERLDRKDPTYQLDNLYYQESLVIDYWRMPVRGFREIPLVISSAFEGGFMEPATRLHSEMLYEDIRARMPPFVETIKKGVIKLKALSKSSTFSGRSRHFREAAGAISWDKREGSGNIKSFIEDIVRPENNSSRGSRDLTRSEVNKLRLANYGTKPGRSKQGTTQESKKKYKAEIERAAGLTPATVPPQNIECESDNNQEPTDEGDVMDYMSYYDDFYETQQEKFMVADSNKAAPPRFVFRCTEGPSLQPMTEEEALMNPSVDFSDARNHVPKFPEEIAAIRDALKVTVEHFKETFGVEPMAHEGANYISEYCNIQDQMDNLCLYEASALRRLGPWKGTIFEWQRAGVEDDPCVGRSHPI